MKLRREFRSGVAGCMLALTWWICAPLQAEQPAPAPEAAPSAAAFSKGPLPPHVAEQVRAIVMAAVKASLPPVEEGAVEIDRVEKDAILSATVDGKNYSGKVFRPFLAEPTNPDEFFGSSTEHGDYYVRTTAPWQLKAGLVIPADIYLSGAVERVSAYDADMIAAQDAAIARSEAFRDAALGQLGPERKAKAATISDAHKADADSLTEQIKKLTADISKIEAWREQVTARFNNLPPNQTPRVTSGKDPSGKYTWQWNAGVVTFHDDLDQSRQDLAKANAAQKALQATTDAEVTAAVGQPGVKERSLRAVFQTHRRRILAGEIISDEDMRADYESALGEPLKAPSDSDKLQPASPATGKRPIQVAPAPKTRDLNSR